MAAWRDPVELEGLEVVGYSDVGDRPPFKLALSVVDDRWYLFTGHLWHRGWSILDVTDPAAPTVVATIPGPANTWTTQVNVADGLLVGGLARIPPRWGGDETADHDEAAVLVDVREPTTPREVARIGFGGTGSHRNFWAGGRYAYLATNARDHAHYLLIVVDVEDRSAPREVGRFWLPGQGPGEPRPTAEAGVSLHGPAYVVDGLAYLAYGGAGMVILDVADPTVPRLVSRWSPAPPFHGGLFGAGVHTVRPLPGRGLAVVNGEAHEEMCREPMTFAGIVDVSDPEHPWLVSTLPQPVPPAGLGYRSYCDKGGRFGPHNQHLAQGHPDLDDDPLTVHLTWFNAGLRIYDVADARTPREVARFVPADPERRYGPLPETALVTQSEDVLVDRRGIIYVTDKHQGVHLLRRTGREHRAVTGAALPTMMRAVALTAFGGPERLELLELPVPTPAPDEVLIRVHTVAANRQDTFTMAGRAQARHPVPLPHILGIDPAGVVVAHGAAVTDPPIGTRVVVKPAIACGICLTCLGGEDDACPSAANVGVHRPGGMAEYVAVPATNAFPIPDGVGYAEATAIAHSFPVALQMLRERAHLRRGETVLVTGAGGAIGSACVQLARTMGATVIAAAGGPERAEYVRGLGADVVIDYAAHPEFEPSVRAHAPDGVDVYVESAGDPAIWTQALAALGRRGRVVVCGSHAGGQVGLDLNWLFRTRASILGSSGSSLRIMAEVLAMAGRGEISPNIHVVLPLEAARDAFAILYGRHNRGKVVLAVIDPDA